VQSPANPSTAEKKKSKKTPHECEKLHLRLSKTKFAYGIACSSRGWFTEKHFLEKGHNHTLQYVVD
jgi:hypothetical protein